jgi:hypothetical protein
LPAGEAVPAAQEPGKPTLGVMRELPVKPAGTEAEVCLAYAAPAPMSDLYAPYLMLVARLQAQAAKLGAGPRQFPVYCPLFDDPAVVCIKAPAKAGETAAQAQMRLRAFVTDAMKPPLVGGDTTAVSALFGPMLGITDTNDELLAANPYFVAFSLGRRHQLGIDAGKLKAALAEVRDDDLRRTAREIFGPKRHASVFVPVAGK